MRGATRRAARERQQFSIGNSSPIGQINSYVQPHRPYLVTVCPPGEALIQAARDEQPMKEVGLYLHALPGQVSNGRGVAAAAAMPRSGSNALQRCMAAACFRAGRMRRVRNGICFAREDPVGRSSALLLLVAAAVAGWFAIQRYEIRGLDDVELVRRDGTEVGPHGAASPRGGDTIKIASFNLHNFGPAKIENTAVMEVIARIVREFDLVAIQEICSPRPDILRSLLDAVNATGCQYSILVGPPVGRTAYREQFVYLFDQTTIETDRGASYTVEDPDDLLHRPPLVGWFRTRGPAPDKAFTFTLVNVHTDPDEVDFETRHLVDVFYKVRDDGRGEDDLIMLGDFNASDRHLNGLGNIPQILAAISATPTNTRQTEQYDNVLFQLSATVEYAGRSGVFDFMREFNLTLEQALQVSDHLPVWAEFQILEGGDNPVVASMPATVPKR